MTSPTNLDDLRASLTAHADAFTQSLTDAEAAGRSASLHTRIRRARNRRRGALAGGVAAVVLVAGGVYAAATLPGDHHSSQPVIAGHTLDRHVTVTGFSYQLASSAQSTPGEQKFTVHLPKVGSDRVVELVGTDLGAGTGTLRDSDDESDLARVSGSAQEAAPVPVDSSKHDVTVVLRDAGKDAQVGVAVYDRDGSEPTGLESGYAIFRDRVADDQLLGGGWNTSPTKTTLRLSVELDRPVAAWRLADECTIFGTHIPAGLMLEERIDGKPFGGTGCTKGDDAVDGIDEGDAGTGGSQPEHMPLAAGDHRIDLRIVDRDGNIAQLPNEVSFGAAIYSVGLQTTIDGMPVDHVIEANGRLWTLDQRISGDSAEITGPAYVMAVTGRGSWHPVAQHLTAGDHDMELSGNDTRAAGASLAGLGEVLAGSTYRFVLDHVGKVSGTPTILIYRPAG